MIVSHKAAQAAARSAHARPESRAQQLPDLPGASGRLFIDLDALRGNYRKLADRVAPAICGAVVKSEGYGLGAAIVAPQLEAAGCRDFFVTHLSEALALQEHLDPASRIFVLNGLVFGTEHIFAERGFIPVLNSLVQVEKWLAHAPARGARLPAALQFDTGMTRLGLSIDDARTLAELPGLTRWLDIQLVLSHLACADVSGDPTNQQQAARFAEAARLFPGVPRSLANSGGIFLDKGFHHDLVRAGIALYGGVATDMPEVEPTPVIRLQARILQVRSVSEPVGVGYGLTHRTTGPVRLATLGVGYGDGWPRALSNRGAAWSGGHRLPIVGRVSMDSMTVDLGDLPPGRLAEGDWVDLIGPAQSIDDVARDAGTISYEILTQLGARYQRVLIGGQTAQGERQ
ncbi:MAG: alanine racemase [Sphingomonadales bacterium]|nr:MAG: alanine racemase [Sphingomonadales bacterium]